MQGELPTSAPVQEAEWIRQIGRRDRAAFERFYASYGPRVFRFVVRMLRDEDRAEELVNDVMVEVWKSADRFQGRSSVSTWVFGIARHRALNAVRGKRIETTPLDEGIQAEDEAETAEMSVHRKSVKARLRKALDALSPEHREVVELTFFQGLSYKEIAQVVGCPENTVKTRMFHARKKLKPLLAEVRLSEESA
jgi:RNA polymerase sigma-70 factor (ECF subfamily)